jgi:hypothetical protein
MEILVGSDKMLAYLFREAIKASVHPDRVIAKSDCHGLDLRVHVQLRHDVRQMRAERVSGYRQTFAGRLCVQSIDQCLKHLALPARQSLQRRKPFEAVLALVEAAPSLPEELGRRRVGLDSRADGRDHVLDRGVLGDVAIARCDPGTAADPDAAGPTKT